MASQEPINPDLAIPSQGPSDPAVAIPPQGPFAPAFDVASQGPIDPAFDVHSQGPIEPAFDVPSQRPLDPAFAIPPQGPTDSALAIPPYIQTATEEVLTNSYFLCNIFNRVPIEDFLPAALAYPLWHDFLTSESTCDWLLEQALNFNRIENSYVRGWRPRNHSHFFCTRMHSPYILIRRSGNLELIGLLPTFTLPWVGRLTIWTGGTRSAEFMHWGGSPWKLIRRNQGEILQYPILKPSSNFCRYLSYYHEPPRTRLRVAYRERKNRRVSNRRPVARSHYSLVGGDIPPGWRLHGPWVIE